jgi:vacuolar protein sorting-associated protein 53
VVDVLGADVRTQVLERYVSLELKDYRRIFRATDEAGQLDNISRRFAWFRRLLQTHEVEQGRVFPAEWKVGWHLLARFVEITRYACVSYTFPYQR